MSQPQRPMRSDAFLLGLIGAGIDASRSPAMHEAEGASQGLRVFYQLLNVDYVAGGASALAALLNAAELAGFAGVNVTHPCKQAVIPLLDTLSAEARALGAVNTVVLREGKRHGHNTDWWGFGQAFDRGLPGERRDEVVMLGAGGAGAAVGYALLQRGVRSLAIVDADQARAVQLAATLAAQFNGQTVLAAADLANAMRSANGLVHCTPTGMAAHPGLPLPATMLRADMWVADIVYFPLQTALLQTARALGCQTLDGGGMAVFQAAGAFALFTGHTANADRMLHHFAALG